MNEEGLHPTCKTARRRRPRSKESCNIYNTSFIFLLDVTPNILLAKRKCEEVVVNLLFKSLFFHTTVLRNPVIES
jgi:hypothetical protein